MTGVQVDERVAVPRLFRGDVGHGGRVVLLRQPLLALCSLQLLYSSDGLLVYEGDLLLDRLPDEVA